VRGPKHVVKKGKTPVLDGDEAEKLLDSIDVSTIVGLRDRALIALLTYSFARISAALHMNVDDYYPQGKRWWVVRLHEKGGKQREMPAHHLLEAYLDAYIRAAGIGTEKNSPLFRTLSGRGRKQLTADRTTRHARRMIVHRAMKAGIITRLGCHTFRATGITVYLLNGGLLEYAQQMVAHESARTTELSTIGATTKSRSTNSSGSYRRNPRPPQQRARPLSDVEWTCIEGSIASRFAPIADLGG
jgi:integrase